MSVGTTDSSPSSAKATCSACSSSRAVPSSPALSSKPDVPIETEPQPAARNHLRSC